MLRQLDGRGNFLLIGLMVKVCFVILLRMSDHHLPLGEAALESHCRGDMTNHCDMLLLRLVEHCRKDLGLEPLVRLDEVVAFQFGAIHSVSRITLADRNVFRSGIAWTID